MNPDNSILDWCCNLLRCPDCKKELYMTDRNLNCRDCGKNIPINNSVPMIMSSDTYIDVAEKLAKIYGISDQNKIAHALASSARYRLINNCLNGEYSNTFERYHNSPTLQKISTINPEKPICLIAEYFNTEFSPAQKTYRSIRIKNQSGLVLSSTGPEPFYLSYWLIDYDGKKIGEVPRSPFPVPLDHDREATVPLFVEAPSKLGQFSIRVMLVQESVRWFIDCPILERSITINERRSGSDGPILVPHEGFFDFDKDIKYCGHLIQMAHGMHMSSDRYDKHLLVGEVACGSDPQSLRHFISGSRVVAFDVSYDQLQLAALRYVSEIKSKESIQFICCDAEKAPIKEKIFDMIIISAALHHFTDLVKALLEIKRMLADHGHILIMREPCKVAPNDPVYINELKNGFNEQQFEIEEYETIFERAGLFVIYHEIHFECSYKAILRKIENIK